MANGSQKQRRIIKARLKKKEKRSGRFKVDRRLQELTGQLDRDRLEAARDDLTLASDHSAG